MPKIRDLAINTIPSAGPSKRSDADGYWMCQKSTVPPPQSSNCSPKPKPKYTGSLTDDAVVQLRQQLRNQIHG